MGAELPEPAVVVQAWLNHHMGESAPTVRMREDRSLFVEGESGPLEACAVIAGRMQPRGNPIQEGNLWCLNSRGERYYCQASPAASAIVVSRKPAGVSAWRYERWQDGALDLVADNASDIVRAPGSSDPEVDALVLRSLWPQQDLTDDEIAQRLGLPTRTVRRRAFALGLPDRAEARKDGYDRLALLELWGDPSVTKTAICQRLNITPAHLARLAQRLELPERPKRPKASQRPRRPAASSSSSPSGAGSSRSAGNTAVLRAANQRRTQAAVEPMLDRTRAALALPESDVPQHLREGGELRVAHPQASLAELAELAGCSKDTMTGRLRRLWQLADQAQPA